MRTVHVTAAFDDEAGVWYVADSDLPGLVTEAETFEALRAKLPAIVEDIIDANDLDMRGEVTIELTAHARAVAHA
jgi:predicted RNase H-like HicB family nuclease